MRHSSSALRGLEQILQRSVGTRSRCYRAPIVHSYDYHAVGVEACPHGSKVLDTSTHKKCACSKYKGQHDLNQSSGIATFESRASRTLNRYVQGEKDVWLPRPPCWNCSAES